MFFVWGGGKAVSKGVELEFCGGGSCLHLLSSLTFILMIPHSIMGF